jgi:Nif-specific regulatory protein
MPLLIVREPGRVAISVPLTDDLRAGRGEGNDIALADHKASRKHARFSVGPDGVSVEDVGSTHGTLVNGARVERHVLRDGDRIQIGSTLLSFHEREDPQEIALERATTELPPRHADGAERRLRLFYEVARAVGSSGDVEELLARTLDAVLDTVGGQRAVAELGSAGDRPRRISRARDGAPPDEIVVSRRLIEAMMTRRQGILVGASAERSPTLVRHSVLSALGVPLQSGPRVLGFLYVDDRERDERFSIQDLEFAITLGHLVGAAIESAERRERAEAMAEALGAAEKGGEIVGASPPMAKLKTAIQKYGNSGAAVLVRGESGTGKELVARSLHACSPRAEQPFVALNCAAIPETMIESELFGHVKGAFTGALRTRRGKFALADRGTLFLDEIGDLSLAAQAKVLRAIQEGEIVPVGGDGPSRVDVRLIAATHKDLRAEISAGRFRDDLYYRLKVVELEVPPLRERGDDIPLLAHALLQRAAKRLGKAIEGFTPEAMVALRRYRWPGNVRELMNEMERAAIATESTLIAAADLSREITGGRESAAIAGQTLSLAERFAELEPTERQLVTEALEKARGNVSEAARLLGITRIMMKRRMDRFGLGHADD